MKPDNWEPPHIKEQRFQKRVRTVGTGCILFMLIPIFMYGIWLFSGDEDPSLLWAIPLALIALLVVLANAKRKL
ncbi:MAG: hypothetical protein ABTQ73_02315 [Caldilineales bacterium]